MEIERLSKDEMRVVLTEAELGSMDLTYDSFDYENPAAKRAIRRILQCARDEIGFVCAGGRVNLTLYPKLGGGCELYATRLCSGEYFVRFDRLDDFLSAKEGFAAREYENICYTDGHRYYMKLSMRSAVLFAGEFGGKEIRPCGGYLREHGRKVT